MVTNFSGKYDQHLRVAVQRVATGANIHWVLSYLDFNYYKACALEEKHKDDLAQAEFRKKSREECERILRIFIATGDRPDT